MQIEAADKSMTTAYPLAWPMGWPRAAARKSAKFSKGERRFTADGQHSWNSHRELTVADATKRVLTELERLGVRHGDAIISTNLVLRLDGYPRSDQRAPADPGAAVYWIPRGEKVTKVMAIDRYDRVADNLAAIAATLEAMRAIERHGGGQILERAFTGFTALPPPKSCWDTLGMAPTRDGAAVTAKYRDLARKHHPDNGGDHGSMAEINAARDEAMRQIGGAS